jgi:transposase
MWRWKFFRPSSSAFNSRVGRPSIPPEKLLRALLAQAFYGIRTESDGQPKHNSNIYVSQKFAVFMAA